MSLGSGHSAVEIQLRYRRADGEFADTTLERVVVDDLLAGLPVREFRWYRGRRRFAAVPGSAGPHPTCREFVAQLAAWGFTERGEKHVHTIFRGPRGGTLRVLRSQLGRADPVLVEKAARLAGVTAAQFWDGPPRAGDPAPPQDTAADSRGGRKRAAHDSVISLVLAVHAQADRPLGFDQVVELAGNRVTRAQVSAASAALCRGGQLDRIRAGVYQWTAGQRAATRPPAGRRPDRQAARMPAAELFDQLFPSGVQMTGELLADLEQWARLTSKLTADGGGTAA